MNHIQRGLRLFAFILITFVIAFPAIAADIVAWQAGPSGLVLRPLVPFDIGVLTVNAPDGVAFREEFKPGTTVVFTPHSRPRYQPPDGTYVWEVMLARPSAVDPRLREAAKAARESGETEGEVMYRAALSRVTLVQSGGFRIVRGQIVPSDLVEPGARAASPRSGREAPNPFKQAEWLHDDPSIGPVDQVIPDDLIVQGSACVGLDCVNNENFGFDTIRLKENNLRIHFDDTSTSAGFPANDWRLIANDSASGGQSKFSIEDSTGARTPFTVEAGATTNSVYIDSTGRVGFRTSTPVLDLHVNTSNTPAMRLEQNNSGGFTAQTWDVAGNEANFFVRDVTGGSRLPFRIRPGAPTSSIDISADGFVGIGTAGPDLPLHVMSTNALPANSGTTPTGGIRVDNFGDLGNVLDIGNAVASPFGSWLQAHARTAQGTNNPLLLNPNGGNVGIGISNPAHPLHVGTAAGAHVTAGGIWTNGSSRAVKQDIRELTAQEAHGALDQLAPVRYTSKVDPTEHHVGFIAEDVPDLVATKDRKSLSPMDIVAVLTRVVQEQQKTMEAQQRSIAELAAKLEALTAVPAR